MSNFSPVSTLTERARGIVKSAVGVVFGNDDLRREGELHKEKAAAAETATKLETDAERERAQAELVAREKEVEVERERLAAETAAEKQKQQAEINRAREEQRIATEAAQQWTAQFNPRPTTAPDFERIYEEILA